MSNQRRARAAAERARRPVQKSNARHRKQRQLNRYLAVQNNDASGGAKGTFRPREPRWRAETGQRPGFRAQREKFWGKAGRFGAACVAEGVVPSPGAGVRHRKPAGLRNPRRGGWADGRARVFVRQFAGARCPALRSAGLFGSETGSPRAHAALCAAWVSSRGGGRRAEPGLRTSRQEKPAAEAAKTVPAGAVPA